MMYISSDGIEKNVKTLNTEYVINALAKAYREIFNSNDFDEFAKYSNNITVLREELDKRINDFVNNNIEVK